MDDFLLQLILENLDTYDLINIRLASRQFNNIAKIIFSDRIYVIVDEMKTKWVSQIYPRFQRCWKHFKGVELSALNSWRVKEWQLKEMVLFENIQIIRLWNIDFATEEEVKVLARSLSLHSNLSELYLGSLHPNDSVHMYTCSLMAMRKMKEALCTSVVKHTQLKRLYMDFYSYLPPRDLMQLSNLVFVNADQGMFQTPQEMIQAITSLPNLKELFMRVYNVPSWIDCVLPHVYHLKRLWLILGNHRTFNVELLLRHIPRFICLEGLFIGNHQDRLFVRLVNALKELPKLKLLCLRTDRLHSTVIQECMNCPFKITTIESTCESDAINSLMYV